MWIKIAHSKVGSKGNDKLVLLREDRVLIGATRALRWGGYI